MSAFDVKPVAGNHVVVGLELLVDEDAPTGRYCSNRTTAGS